jgi:hypothetical protein
MSMKISNDSIGNRSCDFPVCSALPPPLRHRVPLLRPGNVHKVVHCGRKPVAMVVWAAQTFGKSLTRIL